MDDIQTILALISALLGIILLILKILEAWIKVSGPVTDILSKPVVSIVIAALILLGVALIICRPQRRPVVAIKTTHNRYATAMDDKWTEFEELHWVLRAETDEILEYEEFTLLCREKGKVALQTWHKTGEGKSRYVTAMDDKWTEVEELHWVLKAQADEIREYEEFTLLDADTGKRRPCSEVVQSLEEDGEARVAFQTWHTKDGKHRLVTAMDDTWIPDPKFHWVLRAETNVLGASEKFTLELLRWERKFNVAACAIATGGSLLILSAFLVIYWRKSKASPKLAGAGSEISDGNARHEQENRR